jgi:hypothetical protein
MSPATNLFFSWLDAISTRDRLHDGTMSAPAMRDMRRVDELIASKLASDKQQP